MAAELNEVEWQEVLYAIDTKINLIKDGKYDGPDLSKEEKRSWINDLESAREKIEERGGPF